MFAVVQVGNQQYKVGEGDLISAHRLDFEKGKSIVLDKVLLFSDGNRGFLAEQPAGSSTGNSPIAEVETSPWHRRGTRGIIPNVALIK